MGVAEGGVSGQGAGALSPCWGFVCARVLLRVRMEGRGSGDAGAGHLAGSTVGCHVLAARLRFCGTVARCRGGAFWRSRAATLYSQYLEKMVDGNSMILIRARLAAAEPAQGDLPPPAPPRDVCSTLCRKQMAWQLASPAWKMTCSRLTVHFSCDTSPGGTTPDRGSAVRHRIVSRFERAAAAAGLPKTASGRSGYAAGGTTQPSSPTNTQQMRWR